MIVLLAISVLFAAYLYYEFVGKRKKYPPGPPPLPLLGNLLQMDQTYPEKAFVEWGKKYGPIFTVWIPTPIVIINEYELMKETVIKQGDIFAGRPEMFIIDALLKGNYGLLFTRGQMWRENRRFALHVLRDFGVGRNQLHSQIMEQATELISNLHQQKAPINVRDYILFAVANVINTVTFGKVWKFGDPEIFKLKDRLERLSKESMGLGMLLLESFPFLRHLEPPLNIGLKRVMAVNNEIIDFLFEQINQHKEALDESQPPKDFTDAYLMEIRKRANGPDAEYFTEWQMMASVYDIWGAGFETTVATLQFAIIYLLNYPEVQRKLHEEMDGVIGREQELTMDDQKRLPYLCATIQEVQRASNVAPINFVRTTTEDIVVAGYLLRKGTNVIPQMPSVHLDDKLFPDPERFDPKRHLDKQRNFVKSDYVMPFSLGKRACMGESLARMELFLFLGTMVQKCEFQSVDKDAPPKIAVTPGFLRSPLPFECIVVPRY